MPNPQEQLTKNFRRYEVECPCCGEIPSEKFLSQLQRLRDRYGAPINPSSVYRCPKYNKKIGGSKNSAHLLCQLVDEALRMAYGALDTGIPQNQKVKRFKLIKAAFGCNFNMVEIADKHLHFAIVPEGHVMANKFYSGFKSK